MPSQITFPSSRRTTTCKPDAAIDSDIPDDMLLVVALGNERVRCRPRRGRTAESARFAGSAASTCSCAEPENPLGIAMGDQLALLVGQLRRLDERDRRRRRLIGMVDCPHDVVDPDLLDTE